MSEALRNGYRGRVVRASDISRPNGPVLTPVPAPSRPDPEAEARARANEIIARAHAEADAIKAQAKREAEVILVSAEKDGEQEARRQAALLLTEIKARHQDELNEIKPALTRIVLTAVENILGYLNVDEIAERLVATAIADIGEQSRLVLYASPEDAPTMKRVISSMMARGTVQVARVELDPRLRPGECRLAARGVEVEVGLRDQLEALERILTREQGASSYAPKGRY